MKTLRFSLEWGTTPIWIMNEDETEVIDNDVPREWENETELLKNLKQLCDFYHSLFTANEKEFSYNGYVSKEQEEEFKALVKKVRSEIIEKLPKGYRFSDQVIKQEHI